MFSAKNGDDSVCQHSSIHLCLAFFTLTSVFKLIMRSGSQVCLARGLCIYTKTPESPQYNAGMVETASQHLHAFAGVRAHMCVGLPACDTC